MDSGRDEVVPKRVHLHDWGDAHGVAVVEGVDAPGQRRACGRFARDDLGLRVAQEVLTHKREGEATEVAATTDAAVDLVRVFAGHLELAERLLTDDRLVHEHVVEDRTEGVLRVVVRGGILDRLGNGDAE